MPQGIRPERRGKNVWHLILAVGCVLIALIVAVLGSRMAINTSITSRPYPTRTIPMRSVVVSPTEVVTRTHVSHSTQLIPVQVMAYTIEGRMADGQWTHTGACAVSTTQFPLGTILYLYNPDGSFSRQCLAEDTGGDIEYGQVDLAMPGDMAGATQWGVRHLFAQVIRRGWDGKGSPTALPTP